VGLGPGKYDYATTVALELTQAQAVVLIVVGGKYGSGFSVQAIARSIPPFKLAEMLENTARELRSPSE
jgi:hypothetical protein